MSKIHSIKQEKRYRNQTMNVLYHLNSKTGTPTIADKSLRSFKTNKQQEVQSSRLSTRGGISVNMRKRNANSKSREQPVRMETETGGRYERNVDRNSSKSLSSRTGKPHDTDKTKKNSYSKFHTEMGAAKSTVHWDSIVEKHFQKRLQRLQNIFSQQKIEKEKTQWQYSHRSSNPKNDKHGRSNSYTGMPSNKAIHHQQKQSLQKFQHLLERLTNKFLIFDNLMEDRKVSMVFDDFDRIISNILQSLRGDIGSVIDAALRENEQKFTDIFRAIQNMQVENERMMDKQRYHFHEQIEEIVTKSLFTTDSINQLQRNGILNFEAQVKKLNDRDLEEIYEKTGKNYHKIKEHYGLVESQQYQEYEIPKGIQKPEKTNNTQGNQIQKQLKGNFLAKEDWQSQQSQEYITHINGHGQLPRHPEKKLFSNFDKRR